MGPWCYEANTFIKDLGKFLVNRYLYIRGQEKLAALFGGKDIIKSYPKRQEGMPLLSWAY